MKCEVLNCTNEDDQEVFVGTLCAPCYYYLKNNEGESSQAMRNEDAANKVLQQLNLLRYNLLRYKLRCKK